MNIPLIAMYLLAAVLEIFGIISAKTFVLVDNRNGTADLKPVPASRLWISGGLLIGGVVSGLIGNLMSMHQR